MNIYIATQYENKKQAQMMMRRVRGAGHTITYDWTREPQQVGSAPNGNQDTRYWQRCAQNDTQGVLTADLLVVLSVAEGGRGMYTELGLGIAKDIPTIVVGPHFNNLFYFMPNCVRVSNTDEAMALIKDLNKNRALLNKKNSKKQLENWWGI